MAPFYLILLHILSILHLGLLSDTEKFVEKPTVQNSQVNNKSEDSQSSFTTGVSSNKPSVVIVPASKDNDDAEETFTYQIKRQLKPVPFTVPFPFQYGFSKAEETSKQKEEIKSLKSNTLTMEEKINNLTLLVETMTKLHNATETANKGRIDSLQKTISELIRKFAIQENFHNEVHKNTSAVLKEAELKMSRKAETIQLNAVIEQIKPLVLQVQALNTNFDLLRRHKDENNRIINEKLERMDQKVLLVKRSVDNSDQSANDKYNNIKASIGEFTEKIQNMTVSIGNMERELTGEERIIENLQDTVFNTNLKISEIEYSGGEHWTENTNQCGGILIAQSGLISYKFRQPYINNERCIWTIRANRKDHVVVTLLEDGFQNKSNTDLITVSHFQDGNATALITVSKIGPGDRSAYTFSGPIVFVTFQSDGSVPGKGFLLKFEGSGVSTDPFLLNAMKYTHFHLKETSGFMAYPSDKDILYNPNELTTVVINPPNPSATSSKLTIVPRYADFETETTCQYDSVSFYKSSAGSYSLYGRYCPQDTIFDSSKSFVNGPDGVALVVMTSDNSNQFKGFQFSWHSRND